MTYAESIRHAQSKIVRDALAISEGNITKAAVLLSVHRNTLTRLINGLDLQIDKLPGRPVTVKHKPPVCVKQSRRKELPLGRIPDPETMLGYGFKLPTPRVPLSARPRAIPDPVYSRERRESVLAALLAENEHPREAMNEREGFPGGMTKTERMLALAKHPQRRRFS